MPNSGAIHRAPGTCGAVYPSQSWTIPLQITVGMVRAREIQNFSRNMAA